ncbi:MAG: large conductance mechanosensitive channel protein MscL [Oscillospiraceae bacterium]|nr:large conductance mechanosensitive channel protein MscL [Oscillospiraceae bacterium]
MAKKSKLLTEFKEFVMRGNVLDMAVGVIIATAFGAITTTLVQKVFMPLIGYIFGGIDLDKLNITLSPAVVEGEEVVKEAVVMEIGSFLSAIINFLIVALIVFLIVKAINKARALAEAKKKKEEEEKPEEPEAEPEPSKEELLLTEIRDLLAKK